MGFVSQMKEHPDRTVKTLALMSFCFSAGMSIAIVGPTLLDLKQQTHTTLTRIVFAFNFKSVAGIAGALFVGAMYKQLNFLLVLVFYECVMAGVSFSMGFLTSLTQVLVVFLFFGLCIGLAEAGLQVYILQLWGKEATPFMQVSMFMVGLGSLLAPLLATPFLVEESVRTSTGNLTLALGREFRETTTQLVYPYSVVGCIHVLNAFFFALIWIKNPITTPHPSRDSVTRADHQVMGRNTNGWKMLILTLHVIFVHIYVGQEIIFGSFLTTFAVKSDQHMTKVAGSQLTSFFWTTFTFMKLAAIGIIPCIGNGNNILLGLAITGMGNGILYLFGTIDHVGLWVGTGLIAAGLSSLYACSIRYLESYFPVTEKIGVANGIAFMSGEFTFPFIISLFLDKNPNSFPTLVLVCSGLLVIVYLLVMILCKWKFSVPEKQDAGTGDYHQME